MFEKSFTSLETYMGVGKPQEMRRQPHEEDVNLASNEQNIVSCCTESLLE